MCRCQCKNRVNNIKANMAPSEPSGSTSARPEHLNAEEAEEIDLKNDFKKMIEAFKEEMKTTLKEFKEKTKTTMEGINKSLKESQEKAIKQVHVTVQDLKTEIEAIKKKQTERRLEIENLSKRTGTTDANITNRIQEMEDRISGIEDTIEETDLLAKENTNTKKVITQNVQEIWDTMKKSNLRIIGIEEGEEYQLKGTKKKKIIEENFPNLKKKMPIEVQEAYRTPNRLNPKKDPLPHNN
ncbi:hypothetical protein STEG23_020363 [Scotinomys teguina]